MDLEDTPRSWLRLERMLTLPEVTAVVLSAESAGNFSAAAGLDIPQPAGAYHKGVETNFSYASEMEPFHGCKGGLLPNSILTINKCLRNSL